MYVYTVTWIYIYIYKLGKGAEHLTKNFFGSTGSRKDAEMIGVKLYFES